MTKAKAEERRRKRERSRRRQKHVRDFETALGGVQTFELQTALTWPEYSTAVHVQSDDPLNAGRVCISSAGPHRHMAVHRRAARVQSAGRPWPSEAVFVTRFSRQRRLRGACALDTPPVLCRHPNPHLATHTHTHTHTLLPSLSFSLSEATMSGAPGKAVVDDDGFYLGPWPREVDGGSDAAARPSPRSTNEGRSGPSDTYMYMLAALIITVAIANSVRASIVGLVPRRLRRRR